MPFMGAHRVGATHSTPEQTATHDADDESVETGRLASRLYRLRLDAVNRVAHDVAHDHRNALASVVYSVETLLEETDSLSASDRRACLEDIRRSAQRLDELISGLVNYGANHLRRVEPIDVAHLFDRTTSKLRHHFRASENQLVVDAPEPGLALQGVLPVVVHALVSAVDNALESTSSSVRVEISAQGIQREDGRHFVRLAVLDDGPGIDASIRHRVFEPFFTTRSDAVGVGLTLAREGIASIGGTTHLLEAEAGTCVAFDLPLAGRWGEGE
jgi:signal transduction histidine kinase